MSLPKLTSEDAKKLCTGRDYYIFVDESLSMTTPDCPGATSRWNYTKEVVNFIVTKCDEFDPDTGIDLVFFGGQPRVFDEITSDNLAQHYPERPTAGSTYLGTAFDLVFKRYFGGAKTRPITIVVLTDGEASDPKVVETALRNAGQASASGELVAVAFWQIGYDAGAARFLKKLDDDLGEIDIVDTQSMDTVVDNFGSLEILLAAAIVD
ncbi:MAG: VWA domain-containing protein [Leptolyngbyaceae cyanobacterium CRU_2_3]|nr:VWA domain-containing protein [Leptolyngbyaceae cyanobacterium CRU_2_3]